MINIALSRLVNQKDYDPFGMITFGRSWEAGSEYRYGFNGYEDINEILKNQTVIDFGERIYDPRIGKFLSLDPKGAEYCWQSGYAYYKNSPLLIKDKNGLGGPKSYTVKDGDSPESIASANGITIWELASSNYGPQEAGGEFTPIGDGNYQDYWVAGKGTKWRLNVGDVLVIPGEENSNNSGSEWSCLPNKSQNNSESASNNENKFIEEPGWFYYVGSITGITEDIIIPIYKQDLASQIIAKHQVSMINKNTAMVGENGIKWVMKSPNIIVDYNTPKYLVSTSTFLKVSGTVMDGVDVGISIYNAASTNDPNLQSYYVNEAFLKTPQFVPGAFGLLYGLAFDPIIEPGWKKGAKSVSYTIDLGADPSYIFIMPGLGYSPALRY